MALPTLEKTWEFNVNNIFGPYGTVQLQAAETLYWIKQTFVGFATSPWAVTRSSDSTSVADGDLWTDTSKLVWTSVANGVRSWAVFTQPALGNYQLLIVCYSGGFGPAQLGLNVFVSPSGGFTGGTVTTRPTAPDEVQLLVGAAGNTSGHWMFPQDFTSPSATRFIVHIWHATDGTTRLVLCRGGKTYSMWSFEKASEAASTWTGAIGSMVFSGTTSYASFYDGNCYIAWNDAARFHTTYGGTLLSAYIGAEGCITSPLGEQLGVANEISGQWGLYTPSINSLTAGKRGRLGRLSDLWWTHTGLTDGDTMGTGTFVVFKQWVYPWNGSAPLTS